MGEDDSGSAAFAWDAYVASGILNFTQRRKERKENLAGVLCVLCGSA